MNRLLVAFSIGIAGCAALNVWVPWREDHALIARILATDLTAYRMLYWPWTAGTFIAPLFLGGLAATGIKDSVVVRSQTLPVYVEPQDRDGLYVVLGERRNEQGELVWEKLPALGLYNGLLIIGATGRGKTSCGMLPVARQLAFYKCQDAGEKVAAFAFEPKGNFCHKLREILAAAGRDDDYVEIGPGSTATYNPLDSPLSTHELAQSIGSLIEQSRGRHDSDPFWRSAYSGAIEMVLDLYRVTGSWITLKDVYRLLVNDELLMQRVSEVQAQIEGKVWYVFSHEDYSTRSHTLKKYGAERREDGKFVAPWSEDLEMYLRKPSAPSKYEIIRSSKDSTRLSEWDSVKFAVYGWMQLEQQFRPHIVETCRNFLRIFDKPDIAHTFCPPQDDSNKLPPFRDLIESGKWVGVNFPPASDASLSRFVNVMVKLSFEREVLQRIERGKVGRPVAFLADEADRIVSSGANDPVSDDTTLARGREAKLIAVWALHSASSLKVQLGENWRAMAQHFSSKVVMGTTDDLTAEWAEKLCGREEQWRESYSLGESGQKSSTDPLVGVSSRQHGVTAGTNYTLQYVPRVPARRFSELRNSEAIALLYDGRETAIRELKLKPDHAEGADRLLTWDEQRKRGIV